MVDNAADVVYNVDLAVCAFAETADDGGGVDDAGAQPTAVGLGDEAPDVSLAVIGEEVVAEEGGVLVAAVDIAAGNGAAFAVVVFGNGAHQPGRVAVGVQEAVVGFHDVPAVIEAAGRPGRGEIHLFIGVLAHIGDV